MKKFFKSMLSDERGTWSHKRVIGITCALVLCACLIITSIIPKEFAPPTPLIDAVLTLACVCIAGTTIDKFSFKEKPKSEENA
jgi:hypothetical protein